MKFFLSISVLAAVLVLSHAHLCMLFPRQRGSMTGINTQGANDCILLTEPCGGRKMDAPMVTLRSGQNVTVYLLKNLDHFNQATPGHFEVNILSGLTVKEIGRTPDTSDKSGFIYEVDSMIPMGLRGNYILQAVYVTMNPGAPAKFYQCADIEVHQ